ncbi:hypothetical protein SeLEV6574_g02912 [Synchytrium endobioticum]|nr:hypothetical protein SeLEV6574_g02912 [Synchytrium endobioticum]
MTVYMVSTARVCSATTATRRLPRLRSRALLHQHQHHLHQSSPPSIPANLSCRCGTTRHQSTVSSTISFTPFNVAKLHPLPRHRPSPLHSRIPYIAPNSIRFQTNPATPNTAVASESPVTSLLSAVVSEAKSKGRDISPRTILATSTGNFRVSHRKLNLISRLIAKLPLSDAISQCRFSLKRAAVRVLNRLKWAEKKLIAEGHNPKHWYVKEAWVGKGSGRLKRLVIHARSKRGVMYRPFAHLKFRLWKLTPEEIRPSIEFKLARKIKKETRLFMSMEDTKPIQVLEPIWSRKPWKYVDSPKWNGDGVWMRK